MKPEFDLGPWPLGIDNVDDPTALRTDQNGKVIALADAVNVDIDRRGGVLRRRGMTQVQALPGLHSLWSGAQGTYGVAASVLYQLTPTAATPIATLESDDACSYDVLNDTVVIGSRTTLARVQGGIVTPLAIPAPGAPLVAPSPVGSLPGGRYAVGISYLRGGEEGALSPLSFVDLADGQGLQVSVPTAPIGVTAVRIYRTHLAGTVPYQCADVPAGLPSYVVGNDLLGRQAETQFLVPMPPGEHITVWRGRLLVARGRVLVISEPMNYGLTSARSGFVQFDAPIRLVIGVPGGVYVGTRNGVFFLQGPRPGEWRVDQKSSLPPVAGCRAVVDGDQLASDLQLAGRTIGVWLCASGFVLGTDDGTVIEPQAERLSLTPSFSGAMAAHARRFTATLH